MFSGIMVTDGNYLYSIGVRGANLPNRMVVVRYNKDLTMPSVTQYRNYNDSAYSDILHGAVLSADGKTLYVDGAIDTLQIHTDARDVLLTIDTSTGAITPTDLGSAGAGGGGVANMIMVNGTIYGVKDLTSPVKIDATTKAVTALGMQGVGIAIDAANGTLYVSPDQVATPTPGVIGTYDLNGNPK